MVSSRCEAYERTLPPPPPPPSSPLQTPNLHRTAGGGGREGGGHANLLTLTMRKSALLRPPPKPEQLPLRAASAKAVLQVSSDCPGGALPSFQRGFWTWQCRLVKIASHSFFGTTLGQIMRKDCSCKLVRINTASTLYFSYFTACWNMLPRVGCYQLISTMAVTDGHAVEETFDLFLSTIKEHCPIKDVCHSYVEELCRSGKLQDVKHLLGHFRTRHIHPSLKTYNYLLAAASEVNDFSLVCYVFKDLLHSRSPPDLSSYTILVKSFNKVDNPQAILGFTLELSEITADKDPTVMNRIIFILGKVGQIDTALMIYEGLKNHNCKMDTVTFNTVLALLGKVGQLNRMLSEFSLMKELGHTPDFVTYNTIINSLRRFGRLDLCSLFIKEMSDKGIELDVLTYTAIIDGFGRAGRTEDAVRVLDEMKKFRLQPSIYVYRALIDNLKKSGKLDLANRLLEEMKSVASKLLGPRDIEEIKRRKH
ncbi:hypothetical protein Taro_038513 [Colocasia esculenta]|uniref:Pentatricopeptide repeat-containing protein n=2 Tax=Colocasia esculenta TaxID=4460 RepID=A0A843WJH3_COLES|nr:hypothetical protein [Colocasia esculenta]